MKSISDHKYFVVKLTKYISYHKYSLAKQTNVDEKNNLPGYPSYAAGEDIYNQGKEETEINPENISAIKTNEEPGVNNEKDYMDDASGSDLDVPGSELDDAQEEIGSEDEENNLYSLGGDNHDN